MELWQQQYIDQLILSIKSGNPVNFPDVHPAVDNRRLSLFKDAAKALQAEYESFKQASLNNASYFVGYILQHLKGIKDEGPSRKSAYDIFKRLYIDLDYGAAPAEIQKKFDDGVKFLEKKISYFCSYTTKGLPELNTNYEPTVVGVFGVNKNKEEDKWKGINYVAKLIVRYLNERGNHNYFFDRDKLVNGDEIKTNIFDYCDRAVVLVILAQQETFRDIGDEEDDETRNWCFAEYEKYTESHTADQQILVYKIPGIKRPIVGNNKVKLWFDYLTSSNGILNSVITRDAKSEEIKNIVFDHAEQINASYNKLFSNIVNA
jgi:hypothetical protein